MGRVGGIMTPKFMGTLVAGMALSGVLKESFSLLSVYVLSGLLFLVGALLLIPLLQKGKSRSF